MADNRSQNVEVVTEFGEKLTDLRKEKGLTQQQLADMLGVSVKTINQYENNPEKDLSFFTVKRISSIFNVSIDYLAGYKTNKPIQDVSLDTINLTKEAVDSVSTGNYDHVILSDILSHPHFNILMLDIMVLYSQQYAVNMAQRNAAFEFSRQQILSQVERKENVDTKLLELSGMDDDLYVMNVIHADLDTILNDLKIKYISKDVEDAIGVLKSKIVTAMDAGLKASQESTSVKHSPDHFMDIIFETLGITADKLSAEQREELVKIIKLSPLVKSNVSMRGKI